MITEADRQWLDNLYRQAVIHVYEPWLSNRRLRRSEREYATSRVTACRAELARTQNTMPLPAITGGS